MRRELARFAKKLQRGTARPHWQGVYANATQVPVDGPGFAGDAWMDMTRSLTTRALEHARSNAPWTAVRSDAQLLAATVARSASSPVRVLDFGGGMGVGYVTLRSALPSTAVSYVVVEGSRVCEEGRRLVRDVEFADELPASRFDVVFACSSLQYIDDHAGLLARFTSDSLILADVPAGNIPTFWSGQLTVAGSTIAYKFMNLDELVATVENLGYKLRVRGVGERPIDTSSLPATHRIERTCNLLFSK